MSELYKATRDSLRNDEWLDGDSTILNKRTGIRLWIANGFPFLKIYNSKSEFSLLEKILLWKEIKKTFARQDVNRLR